MNKKFFSERNKKIYQLIMCIVWSINFHAAPDTPTPTDSTQPSSISNTTNLTTQSTLDVASNTTNPTLSQIPTVDKNTQATSIAKTTVFANTDSPSIPNKQNQSLLIANMTNLIFVPVSITCQFGDVQSLSKLRLADSDFLKNFSGRGISVFENQLAFDNKNYNLFYFIPTNIPDEYSLICRIIDPNTDAVKYAYVIKNDTNNRFVISTNFVEKTTTGFDTPPPSEKIATFQVYKNDTSIFLKKGKNFLTPEDISNGTGFLVMDKYLDGKGLFTDHDIEYSTYKGFDLSFNKAKMSIENLADKSSLITKMISPDKLDPTTTATLVDAIQFSIELAAIENIRGYLNDVILELGKYFLNNNQLKDEFNSKASLFFPIKENATDKYGILENLFNNLQKNINATSDWQINLTENEQEIINALQKDLIEKPKAIAATAKAATEEAARAESMQKRITSATTIDDFAVLLKELSSSSKWFSLDPKNTDLIPDENKIKTSSDQLITNLTTLLSNIENNLKNLKTTATTPGVKIQDTTATSLAELNKRLGLFFSTICWQLFFNNGYLSLDVIGNSNKIAAAILALKTTPTTLSLKDLTNLSVATNTERTFQDQTLLSNLKVIFYNTIQQFATSNDILNLYSKQKTATTKKAVVIAPKKTISTQPTFQLNLNASNVIVG